MAVSVRQKGNDWYIFIRHNGARAAKKYESEEEAREVAKAVRQAMTLGQFDIAAMKLRREPKEEPPAVPTLAEYYENTYKPVYLDSAVAASTAGKHANSFKNQIKPALGSKRLNELTHEEMEEFVSNLVKKKLAKATIETVLNVLRALLNHARKRRE